MSLILEAGSVRCYCVGGNEWNFISPDNSMRPGNIVTGICATTSQAGKGLQEWDERREMKGMCCLTFGSLAGVKKMWSQPGQ